MAFDFLKRKKDKNKPKSLPKPETRGDADSQDGYEPAKPVSARYGTICETRTFANEDSDELGLVKMRAYCSRHNKWAVQTIKIAHNHKHITASADARVHHQKTEERGLTFWEAIFRLAEFEASSLLPESGRQPAGASPEDMGYLHFKAFAEREGTIGFDAAGMPHVAEDGIIVSDGAFLEDDLINLMDHFQEHAKGNGQTTNPHSDPLDLMRDMFSAEALSIDYEQTTNLLILKGHIEEFTEALEGARKNLIEMQSYFDGAYRTQTLEQWLHDIKRDYQEHILPEKCARAGISLEDIFDSAAYAEEARRHPEEYAAFAKALKKNAAHETENIERSFLNHMEKAGEMVSAIRSLTNDATANNAHNICDQLAFTFCLFKAKAQYAYTRHITGNKTDQIHELDSLVRETQKFYEQTDAPSEWASLIPQIVISGAKPQIPEAIDKAMDHYRTICKDIQAKTSHDTQTQLALPLTGGETGLGPYRRNINIDELIERAKEEKGLAFVEKFEQEIRDTISRHEKRLQKGPKPGSF